jgi:hypothetical protein
MTDIRRPLLAVLIDGENTPHTISTGLFAKIETFGETRLRRVYGNFSRPNLKSWIAPADKFAIKRVDVADLVKAKSTADIALAVDAMYLFHIGRFDGFCLVSSDSDFTRLALKLSNRGARVFGFGKQNTPAAFQNACDKFVHIDQFMPKANAPGAKPPNPTPRKLADRGTSQPPPS